MKNMIAAVDFSPVSANAARYAVQLAEFYKANVWLYHSYELPVTHIEYGYPFVTFAELQNASDFQMEELAKELARAARQPVTINTKVEMAGFITGLQSFCKEVNADMVVMGITGKGALTRLLIGSNTIHAIHHLHCPVLIVPADSVFSPYQKIAFAADYEKGASPAAIDMVNNITGDFKASLQVINVDWNNRHFSIESREHQVLLHQQLKAADVSFHNLESEQMTTAIHDFVKNQQTDLLIALPKKHNLVEKLFSRSHTPELLYHSHLPVLCIPE